jgi:transcriptional regulator with XRE-family HTH domain
MVLGQRIRQLRQERHLTQTQFGQVLNLAESTISLYESNHRSPDYHILLQIADYFDVSVDYLLGLTDIRGVTRYKYDEALPAVEDSLPDALALRGSTSENAQRKPNGPVWHLVGHHACPDEGILPNDLLLIEPSPAEVQVGDRILIQQGNKPVSFFRVIQAGDPMILEPLDPKQKAEILTRSSQQRLPVFARVLELRRFYTNRA